MIQTFKPTSSGSLPGWPASCSFLSTGLGFTFTSCSQQRFHVHSPKSKDCQAFNPLQIAHSCPILGSPHSRARGGQLTRSWLSNSTWVRTLSEVRKLRPLTAIRGLLIRALSTWRGMTVNIASGAFSGDSGDQLMLGVLCHVIGM